MNEKNRLIMTKMIIQLLKSVKRDGINELINYLCENNYFNIQFEYDNGDSMSFNGALALHSMYVYQILMILNKKFKININDDSIIICAFLHDLCRIDIQHKFPTGHSEKSIFLIQKFIKLSDDEIMAINSHMGLCDPRCDSYDDFQKSYDISPLALFLYISDMIASSYIESYVRYRVINHLENDNINFNLIEHFA